MLKNMEKNENHFHCCQVVMFDTLRNCFVLTSNSLFQCKFEIFLKILKFFSNSYFCNLLQFSLRLPNIYWIDSVTNNRAQVKIMIEVRCNPHLPWWSMSSAIRDIIIIFLKTDRAGIAQTIMILDLLERNSKFL